jgi:toxin ParE1/3/4
MKPVLLWTPQAREDLIEIYATIKIDDSLAAERIYWAMEKRVSALLTYPRLGMRRPEIASTARVLVEGMYLILYETHPDTDDGPVQEVRIIRIVHGHRDLSRI